mgnify:CR=1 FL=1
MTWQEGIILPVVIAVILIMDAVYHHYIRPDK